MHILTGYAPMKGFDTAAVLSSYSGMLLTFLTCFLHIIDHTYAHSLLLLPPSAFFIIGFLIWAIRSWKQDQIEAPEFEQVETREIPDERPGDIVAARTSL